jgi:hypothetical protein
MEKAKRVLAAIKTAEQVHDLINLACCVTAPDSSLSIIHVIELPPVTPVRSQKSIAAGFVHLDSKNYREVEVLKSSGYLSRRKQVRHPRRHQALIRPQLERFWIYEELFRQHPASRIDDANHRCS